MSEPLEPSNAEPSTTSKSSDAPPRAASVVEPGPGEVRRAFPQHIAKLYEERETVHRVRAEQLASRSRLLSNLRGLSFAVFVVAGLFALFGEASSVSAALSGVGAVAFGVLVARHARVIEAEDEARRAARVNADGRARCSGGWRSLPETGAEFRDGRHPYSDDLDVFGNGSLFQRISVAHTRYGQRCLSEWLKDAASPSIIRARQRAVRALAPELDLRQRLEALSLAVVERPEGAKQGSLKQAPDPEALLRWAEGDPVLVKRLGLRVLAVVFPLCAIGGVVGAVLLDWPAWAWGVPVLVNLALNFAAREPVTATFLAVSATEGAFLRYGAMLELIENVKVDAELVQKIQRSLMSGSIRPSESMTEFRRKVGWFDLRHNGLVHPFVNLFTLWDVHCTIALEKWQLSSGKVARSWFVALGEFEALSSLAGFAHDEPGSSFPELADEAGAVHAEGLGHPLIDAPLRVNNDLTLPGPGTALLVTGSNMSGKSTFLRAFGLAAVMAQAGAPVCAARLRLSPMLVRTSIRVADSLESGVSHFYAELAKLKAVVDATAEGRTVLFLLDEILHGTNSRERQIGARWVIAELLQRGALGVVTTHDMDLCRLPPELMQYVTLVHFRESVQNDRMTFDYKLRPGPVTAGNALRLMRLVGLEVPLEE